MNRIHDHGSAPFSSCSRSSATADTAMTGSQIDPNIVSQDVTAFIATGVIAYPQQDLAAGSSTARPGASPTRPAPEERRAIGHIRLWLMSPDRKRPCSGSRWHSARTRPPAHTANHAAAAQSSAAAPAVNARMTALRRAREMFSLARAATSSTRVQRSGRKHYIIQYRAGRESRRINPGPGPPRVPWAIARPSSGPPSWGPAGRPSSSGYRG